MEKATIKTIAQHLEKEVLLEGWLYNKRSSKKLHFLQIRDGSGIIQAIVSLADVGEEMFKIGEKIWNLQQLFNLRAGLTGADDKLPKRFLEEPALKGEGEGTVIDFEPMLKEYYHQRGWEK